MRATARGAPQSIFFLRWAILDDAEEGKSLLTRLPFSIRWYGWKNRLLEFF